MTDILLIDGDEVLCELLSEYLTDVGYSVQVTPDGNLGLRDVVATMPDLVLLDVMVPRQDGWETLRRVRNLTDLPVIVVSSLDGEADVLRAFSLGATDYVPKPFSFAELAARIQAVLSRTGA
jgi:DNA-binding response OmpR family regulator